MLRYYLIATLIVVAIGSALFAHRLALNGWKLNPEAKGSPRPAGRGANQGFVTTPEPFFRGQGGWVLSALPDCFQQLSKIQGPSEKLAPHVPPPRERIMSGTTLKSGNCSVLVRSNDIWVYRGEDRLRVPPDARLYQTKDGLTLVYAHAGRTEVRVYHESAPGS
jgi:hypothetical protein